MKVEVLAIGKNKDQWIKDAIEEFDKRLSKYCDLDFIIITDEKIGTASDEIIKRKEGEKILSKLKSGYISIVLDPLGQQHTSEEFSKFISKIKDLEGGKIQFIIGGALGLSGEVLSKAKYRLALSRLTFTHQMTRIILLEQLYRAFEIARNSGYHK